MEEVDEMLLRMLRTVGCDVDENVVSVGEMETASFVEGIVKCLWKVKPDAPLDNAILSPSMPVKFKQATNICNVLKSMGFPGALGYESVLYASELDMRNLLLFLSDRMPATDDSPALSGVVCTPRVRAERAFSEAVNRPWMPHFCRNYRLKFSGNLWFPPDDVDNISFDSKPSVSKSYALSDIPLRSVPATILEHGIDSPSDLAFALRRQIRTPIKSPKPALPHKPVILPKPNLTTVSSMPNSIEAQSSDNLEVRVQTELWKLLELVEEEERGSREKETELIRVNNRLDSETSVRERLRPLVEQCRPTAAMLAQPEVFTQKLNGMIGSNSTRIDKLGSKCELAKQQLNHTIAQLESTQGSDVRRLAVANEDMLRKTAELEQELQLMNSTVQTLQREHDKLGKGVKRSAYTKRILEILHSVTKQRDTIRKVLSDTRIVQKDINSMQGKIDRSMFAAQQILTQTSCDGYGGGILNLVKTYRDECTALSSLIQDTGNLLRQVQQFTDQMQVETQNGTAEKLNQLVSDYCEMRQQNEVLHTKLLA